MYFTVFGQTWAKTEAFLRIARQFEGILRVACLTQTRPNSQISIQNDGGWGGSLDKTLLYDIYNNFSTPPPLTVEIATTENL